MLLFGCFRIVTLLCCGYAQMLMPTIRRSTYYNAATGTGATLKSQLNNIIKVETPMSRTTRRSSTLQITDADPNAARVTC